MAMVTNSNFRKPCVLIIFVIVCCFENFLIAGPIYGYSSILEIFKRKNFYHHLCESVNATSSRGNDAKTCEKQDLALNSIFIFGMFFHSIIKFPIGFCVDRFGPQLCQYAGCAFLIFFGISLGLASPGLEFLLFVAFFFLAFACSTLMLSVYKAVNVMCWKWKSVGMCMISGAVDSSSAIFLIFLTSFELGMSLTTICTGYVVITIVFVTSVTLVFFPSNKDVLMIMKQDSQEILNSCYQSNSFEKVEETASCCKRISTWQLNNSGQFLNDDTPCPTCATNSMSSQYCSSSYLLFSQSTQNLEQRAFESNYDDRMLNPGCSVNFFDCHENQKEVQNEKTTLLKKKKDFSNLSLKKCLFSWKNFLSVMLFSLLLLKLLYFVGNLDKYLTNITDNHKNVLDYIKYFGYIQFMGVTLAPISALVLRQSESSRIETAGQSPLKKYIQRVRGCIVPSVVLILTVLILDGLQLVEVLGLCIPIFILYLFGLSLLFCYASVFVSLAFPPQYFCSIYGFTTLVSGVVLLLQYPILSLEETVFLGNQFWVNVIFFFTSLLPVSFPVYLMYHCNELTKQL